MASVGKVLNIWYFQLPAVSRAAIHWIRLSRTLSNLALSTAGMVHPQLFWATSDSLAPSALGQSIPKPYSSENQNHSRFWHWTLWYPWGFGMSIDNLIEVSAGGSTRESLSVVELNGWWWRNIRTGAPASAWCQQHGDLEQEEGEEGTHAAHSSPSSYFPCLWDWSDDCMSQCLGWERDDHAPGSGITHHRASSITALPLAHGRRPAWGCLPWLRCEPPGHTASPACPPSCQGLRQPASRDAGKAGKRTHVAVSPEPCFWQEEHIPKGRAGGWGGDGGIGLGMCWAAQNGWGPMAVPGMTPAPGAGESRDRAGWWQQVPGGAGRTWGPSGEHCQGGGSSGWDFSEVVDVFGCCHLSFPSAKPLSGLGSSPCLYYYKLS